MTETEVDVLLDLSSPKPEVDILLDLSSPKPEPDVSPVGRNTTDSPSRMNPGKVDATSCIEKLMSQAKETVKNKRMVNFSPDNLHKATEDVKLLEEEVFDFDLPLSPDTSVTGPSQDRETAEDNDEEVFFGPVGFREKCAAVVVADNTMCPQPLSPLSASDMVEVFKQAQTVAYYIQKTAPKDTASSYKGMPVEAGSQEPSSPGAGEHEHKGTLTLGIQTHKSEGLTVNLPVTCVQVPEGEDGSGKFVATSDGKPWQRSTSKNPSGLTRRGTLGKSVGRPVGGLKPGAGELPTAPLPASGRKLLETPARASGISPNKRQRTGHNDSIDIIETASVDSSVSLARDGTSGKRKLCGTRTSSYLKAPGSWQRNEATKTQNQRSPSNSLQSNTASSAPTASSIGSGPITSLPVASGLKPTQRKSLGPTYKTGLKPVSRFGSRLFASKLVPASSEPGKQQVSGVPKFASQPKTKPDLLQRGMIQKKNLAANRGKLDGLTSGPLKATAPVKVTETVSSKAAGPMKALSRAGMLRPGTSVQSPLKKQGVQASAKPLMPVKAVHAVAPSDTAQGCKLVTSREPAMTTAQDTPVKKEKAVQPKRLLCHEDQNGSTPPPQHRDRASFTDAGTPTCSKPLKRRSFLPTPSKQRRGSTSSTGSGANRSSTSSASSVDSPARTRKQPPALGALLDLNGIDENSPSCLKPRKPAVQNTPHNKENVLKRSVWSPVPRVRPVSLEDAAILCTKRIVHRD